MSSSSSITCRNTVSDLINHIVFVIDASGSMSSLEQSVIKVFDSQVEYLSVRSQELAQETRVSVYMFESSVSCVVYDKDVMRLPSLKDHYRASGGTSLIDGTIKAMDDLSKSAQLYGDHAFLIYVITDGEENHSKTKPAALVSKIASMPANWTLAVLVPNQQGVFEAKKFGFSQNNIQIWDTSAEGLRKVGDNIRVATEAFLTNRAQGIRGTTNLFNLDLSGVTIDNVKSELTELDPSTYHIFEATCDTSIKPFVESKTGRALVRGSANYQLTKRELIQGNKHIYIRETSTGKVYGGDHSRTLLQLPTSDVHVKPSDHSGFDIFVESTSVNRKILAGTHVLVMN